MHDECLGIEAIEACREIYRTMKQKDYMKQSEPFKNAWKIGERASYKGWKTDRIEKDRVYHMR